MEKKITIASKLLLLLIFVFGVCSSSSIAAKSDVSYADEKQQEIEVSGTVTDAETGEPLPGVNIVVQGTTIGTTTDMDGEYILEAPADATLIFSFVGYQEQTLRVRGRQEIDVAMQQAVTELEEVVAVGYGSMERGDVTGAVSSVQMNEQLASRPPDDFGQALIGEVSGVKVMSNSGRPGASSTIQIRGTKSISAGSEPLIVVDGVVTEGFDLNQINTADIESIEVLKDASSTAIYGSRGSNGVILVTTKSGEKGQKNSMDLSYSFGMQELVRKIDVMNAKEYAKASMDAAQNGWVETGGDPNAPNTVEARGDVKYTWPEIFETPEQLPYDTDWQDVIYREAPVHRVDLSFYGGGENSDYRVSAGYVNRKGIVMTNDYQKYTLNLNTNLEINDRINVGGKFNLLYDNEDEAYGRITEWAIQYPQIYPVKTEEGRLGGPSSVEMFGPWYGNLLFRAYNGHPLWRINDQIENKHFKTLTNVYAEINLLEGLNFETSINGVYNRSDNSHYTAKEHQLGPAYVGPGSFNISSGTNFNYIWKNLLRYSKEFGEHSINFVGGYEYTERDYYSHGGSRRDYDNDLIPYLSGGTNISNAWDGKNESSLSSIFGRVNYNYMNKYLLTATLRRDGSSRFGPENKWGNFPSFALGWRISEESFMEAKPLSISNLKLRASYGFTGNEGIGNYSWISSMSRSKVAIGDNLTTSYYPTSIENRNLSWERTREFNLGIDLGFFNQRIMIDADIYRTVSDELLLNIPIPNTSGFNNVLTNIGAVENKGLEFGITSRNFEGGKFNWTTRFNYSVNRNEVLELGPDDAPMIFYTSAMGRRVEVGEPLFSYYAYNYQGVYMNQEEIDADPASYEGAVPGAGKYEDVNGDGVLNADDRKILGNYEPDFSFDITNRFRYGNFDFSFLIEGTVGNTIYNNTDRRSKIYHEGRNYLGVKTKRWRSEENPGDGYHSRLSVERGGMEKTPSDYWLDDGTFFRLKDVTIGYSIPEKITSSIGISNARIYVNGANLYHIQEATGVYDPENFTGHGYVSPASRGITGSGTYPLARTYSFGVNVEF